MSLRLFASPRLMAVAAAAPAALCARGFAVSLNHTPPTMPKQDPTPNTSAETMTGVPDGSAEPNVQAADIDLEMDMVHEADNLPPEEFAPKYTPVELGRAVDIDGEFDRGSFKQVTAEDFKPAYDSGLLDRPVNLDSEFDMTDTEDEPRKVKASATAKD